MRTMRLTATLVCLSALGIVAPAQAQRRTVLGTNTIVTAPGGPIVVPTAWMQGVKFYSSAQIAQQDMANKSPAAAEVHTYLSNPAAWQKNNMDPRHAVELGVPSFKMVLRNGIIIDEWAIPSHLPPGTTHFHLFTLGPSEVPKGDKTKFWESKTACYQVWVPPGMTLPQAIPTSYFQGFK